ncbi:MAG: hypothetical protein Aurels2KO_05430 [Aureliella sp.]
MSDLLLYYQRPEPATWVFLSSFLLLGIYFVFHRFFSIRNLDLVLLVLLAPGLMMVHEGRQMQLAGTTSEAQGPTVDEASTTQDAPQPLGAAIAGAATMNVPSEGEPSSADLGSETSASEDELAGSAEAIDSARRLEFYGFMALLIACSLLMTRMLLDSTLVRRPLLVPNLSIGGLTFIGASLFVFLMGNVITSSPREQQLRGPSLGPGYALLNMLPDLPTLPRERAAAGRLAEAANPEVAPTIATDSAANAASSESQVASKKAPWLPNVARILAILSNLTIVLGIVGVGYWHFDNVQTGIGCAVMYLLLPYTAQMTGNLQHVMPAALLVLAILMYRQPLASGAFLGLAAGLVYYPLFLLPIWISFYWHRGLTRFLSGVSGSLALLAGLLLLQGFEAFFAHVRQMFGLWWPHMEGLEGIWGEGGIAPDYRLPVLVGFILLSLSFVFWPPRKNLGSLMGSTAAVLLAAQFWHGNGGGLFMAWFLPFTLLTIFRPNLDNRVATMVVRERPKKRQTILRPPSAEKEAA